MRLSHRPQASWNHKPDNSVLQVAPPLNLMGEISPFYENRHQNEQRFNQLYTYLANPFKINRVVTVLDRVEQLEEAVEDLSKDQYIIVNVYNEIKSSYKGYAAWIVMANSTKCYLIDSVALWDHLSILTRIMQDYRIVKLMFNVEKNNNSFKRDFSIFPINYFELFLVESYHPELRERQENFIDSLNIALDLNPEILYSRPLNPKLKRIITDNFNLLIDYTQKIPFKPSDHYHKLQDNKKIKLLPKDFYLSKYMQMNELYHLVKNYRHEPVEGIYEDKCLQTGAFVNLSDRENSLYQMLINFREHIGKMNDIAVTEVLPNNVLDGILKTNNISVLEISRLFETHGLNPGIEICQRIYEVTKLNEQKMQDQEMINKYILRQQPKNQKDNNKDRDSNATIKKLLKQISWGDSSQWLNRKDDPSIKLYKQIISVDEFDHSIGEEYLEGMKNTVIDKKDLGKFLKFAQFMRNKNVDKLKEYVERLEKEEKEERQGKGRREFEAGEGDEDFERDCEGSSFFDSMDRDTHDQGMFFNRSNTSIEERFISQGNSNMSTEITNTRSELQFDKSEKSFFVERKPASFFESKEASMISLESKSQSKAPLSEMKQDKNRSRKSSETESMRVSELDEMEINRADIKPLPNSLEEIYSMAQEVKKKVDKKNSKKKDKKQGKEATKDIEFVPSWEDIQNALYHQNLN